MGAANHPVRPTVLTDHFKAGCIADEPEILPIFTAKTAIHETWMKCSLAVWNPIRAFLKSIRKEIPLKVGIAAGYLQHSCAQ